MRRFGENVYIDMVVVPTANPTDGTHPATYIDVSDCERFAFYRFCGSSDDTSVTMKVVQATSSAGAGSKDVSGAAITATSLGSGETNQLAGVEVQTSMLDINNGFRYVAVAHTATGGSATATAILFFKWRTASTPVTQPASVAEIVYLDG